MTQKRNIAGDKRAASLKLQPRKPQANMYCKSFELAPALTDIDHVEINRFQSLRKKSPYSALYFYEK